MPPARSPGHVIIVGAGFSGTLQAINIVRLGGPRVTLVERRAQAGRGVAFSTIHPDHLLNVRAANMSALPDDPDHFSRWLAARGDAAEGFATRAAYGDYLAELLDETISLHPERIAICQGEAVELTHAADADTATLTLDNGEKLTADAVILALGNLPPFDPAGIVARELPASLYASDPWAGDLADGLDRDAPVLIMGTGLTMVDVALMLDASGHSGPITALSRHGLLPRGHDDAPPWPALDLPPASGPLSRLLRAVRRRSDEIGWRGAIDALRPHVQGLWLCATPAQQARFLRHLRPWWDVHRHRLAPAVARRIAGLREAGRLTIAAGKLVELRVESDAAAIRWQPRGGGAEQALKAAKIINCTGPQGDLLRTREGLLHLLLAAGSITPDRHRLGIEVNGDAQTIDVNGRVNRNLLAIGPMTRGAFWEIVAVPDIREQCWALARRLAGGGSA